MKSRARRRFEQRFHVDLVDQHARAHTPRDLADLFHRRLAVRTPLGL